MTSTEAPNGTLEWVKKENQGPKVGDEYAARLSTTLHENPSYRGVGVEYDGSQMQALNFIEAGIHPDHILTNRIDMLQFKLTQNGLDKNIIENVISRMRVLIESKENDNRIVDQVHNMIAKLSTNQKENKNIVEEIKNTIDGLSTDHEDNTQYLKKCVTEQLQYLDTQEDINRIVGMITWQVGEYEKQKHFLPSLKELDNLTSQQLEIINNIIWLSLNNRRGGVGITIGKDLIIPYSPDRIFYNGIENDSSYISDAPNSTVRGRSFIDVCEMYHVFYQKEKIPGHESLTNENTRQFYEFFFQEEKINEKNIEIINYMINEAKSLGYQFTGRKVQDKGYGKELYMKFTSTLDNDWESNIKTCSIGQLSSTFENISLNAATNLGDRLSNLTKKIYAKCGNKLLLNRSKEDLTKFYRSETNSVYFNNLVEGDVVCFELPSKSPISLKTPKTELFGNDTEIPLVGYGKPNSRLYTEFRFYVTLAILIKLRDATMQIVGNTNPDIKIYRYPNPTSTVEQQ